VTFVALQSDGTTKLSDAQWDLADLPMVRDALASRRPVMWRTEELGPRLQARTRDLGVVQGVCVPLTGDGPVRAALNVGIRHDSSLTTADLHLLESLGYGTGLALSRAESYLRVQELGAESEARRQALERQASFTKAMFDSLHDSIVACDRDGVPTMLNRATQDLHGLRNPALSPQEWADRHALYTADGSRLLEREEVPLSRALAGEQVTDVEVMIAPADGPPRSVLASGRPILDDQRQRIGAVMAMHDITERKRAEDAMRESERNFRLLFAGNPQPMWVFDTETLQFLAVNDMAVERYGYSREEFLSMIVTDIWPTDDVPSLLESLDRYGAGHHSTGEYRHRLKNGRVIDVEIAARKREFAGRPAKLILAQDITERKSLEAQLRHQAFHDSLTGLANRALFMDRVEHALSRSERLKQRCAVQLLDLDNFKTVNDSLGHGAGDELLKAVAERLQSAVRPADTTARLGGDEFAVLLEDLDEQEQATGIAARVLEVLRRPFRVQGRDIVVSASIGVAFAQGSQGGPELLRNADVAMYSAKTRGKGGCKVFSPGMHAAVLERLALEHDLRRGLARNEFLVMYQPQVDMVTGRIVGVEALLRWRHPSRGLIYPDDFITLAEDTGLIVELDSWVRATACRQMRAWTDAGLPLMRLAVNVSGHEFADADLAADVQRTLQSSGLEPSLLELELTESVAVRQSQDALEVLQTLRNLGVTVAVDDFGTGYSILSRLQQFPIDRVKIDRSFIAKVTSATDDAPIVAAMIAMAHGLGLEVVAEGVETSEQLVYLRQHGCDLMQGYLVSRPVTADDFEELMRRQATQDAGVLKVARPGWRLFLEPVAELVSSEPTLESLVSALLGALERLTGFESTYLTRIHWDRSEHTVLCAHNSGSVQVPEGLVVEWPEMMRRWAMERTSSSPDYVPPIYLDGESVSALGVKTHIGVPVIAGDGTVFGTLCAVSGAAIPVSGAVRAVMELFARVIATRIGNDGDMPAVTNRACHTA
jgi:diguanylate cyclase (GGDEF)-like protein/PAS domain S-box-containing protein